MDKLYHTCGHVEKQAWRGLPSLASAVLPQIRASESEGKLTQSIVNPTAGTG